MFCPNCGKKYDGSPIQCPSCKKIIPSLDASRQASTPSPQRPGRAASAAGAQEVRFGSVGDRMLALVFDRALIGALALVVVAALVDQRQSNNAPLPSGFVAGLGGALILVTIVFLYHVIFEAGFGTTVGKAVMGLQVRNESDRNRFVAVIIRNALRVVDGIGLYVVGFLIATFRPRRQRLGDTIGGTVVLDMPMSNAARAAMMVLLIAAIVAAVWVAAAICPGCVPS